MAPSITRNITANWLALVSTGLAGIVVAPFVIRYLGPEQYGVWAIIVAVSSQCMVFDFGIRNALVKFVSEYSVAERTDDLRELLSSALLLLVLIATLLFAMCLGVSAYLPHFAGASPELTREAAIAFVLAALDASIELLSGLAEASLAGRERYDILAIGSAARAWFNAALLVPTIVWGGGMVGVAVVAVLTRAVYRVWLFRRLTKELPDTKISLSGASRAACSKILRYGAWAFLVVVSTRVIYSIDVLIVGYIAGPTAAGMYSVCVMVVEQIRQLAQSGSTVLTPRLSAMQSDQIRTGELLMRSVKVVQAFAVLIVFPVIFTGKGFLALFAGQGYEAAYPILLLLVVPFLICLPAYLFTSFLYASARHELTARLLMIEAITNLVLSLTLIRWLGPVGVAIGTFVPALIFRGILLPREALRIASLDGARYWREMIWRPLPAAVAIVVALELGTLCFGATTLSGWLLTNTLGVLGFSLVAPAVFMSPKEQRSVLNWLHSLH